MKTIVTRVDDDLAATVKKEAEANGLTISVWVGLAILDKLGTKHNQPTSSIETPVTGPRDRGEFSISKIR